MVKKLQILGVITCLAALLAASVLLAYTVGAARESLSVVFDNLRLLG